MDDDQPNLQNQLFDLKTVLSIWYDNLGINLEKYGTISRSFLLIFR